MDQLRCRATWIVLGCGLINFASAQDLQCLYSANAGAVVQIEYQYKTSDEDSTDDEQLNDKRSSKGTGFIVTPGGYVLTNDHVVRVPANDVKLVSEKIFVRAGGLHVKPVEAIVVHRDPDLDLALLQLPPNSSTSRWPTVAVADARNVAVGDPLIGLGFASGDLSIIHPGIKSAHSTVVDGKVKPWWQTTLPLNHGNSGGPIFGRLGTVVGIAVVKNEVNQLVTYIIPIQRAQHLLDYAKVATVPAGRCANYPQCAHASHGIASYAVDELKSAWGEWRSGGYNRPAYCNDYLAALRQSHPASTFAFVRDDEESDRDWVGNVRYRYFCEYRRQETPIYNVRRSPACLK